MKAKRKTIALLMLSLGNAIALLVPVRSTSAKQHPPLPIYNPSPPGLLPADLDSEIARVLREIDVIEGRAIQRWHSLPPPAPLVTRAGPNPPVLKDTGT